MNAAFFEDREFDLDFEDNSDDKSRPQEKFRMARRPQGNDLRKRPKQFNGIHRRRRKKIRL